MWQRLVAFFVCLVYVVVQTPHVNAQVNVALGKSIIDGSGSWDGGFDSGTFPASHVVDGATTEPADGQISYWLGREYTDNEYFTIDLGQNYNIDSVELFNTHNRQFNDRGTDEFVLYAASAVDANKQLVNPIPILSSNLASVESQDDIEGELFNSLNGLTTGSARYLKFEAVSYYSSATNGSSGLNEIRVFDNSFVTTNKAFGKPVIDGSGAWDGVTVGQGAAFNGGAFPATSVTDGSVTDVDGMFWLGREGVENEYFTLDLGSPTAINEILLRNTENRVFADRGTREFRVLASNTVDGSNQLVNPTEILQGQLGNTAGVTPLLNNVFTSSNGLTPTTARYLKFETLGDTYFNDNVGLNEMEVYSTVEHSPTPIPRDDIAHGKQIIDGSGSWDGGVAGEGAAFDAGAFPADRVVDGSVADLNTGRNSYWLGRENTEGEYFTVDLGANYTVDEIDLTNTHNTQYNDRGTDEFVVYGANEVDADQHLINPVAILSGNLTNVSGLSPIPADVFTSANGLTVANVRYLQFVAVNYFSSATNGSSGLNEFAVYGHLIASAGDFDGDGSLTVNDINLLSAAVRAGNTQSRFDVNSDGHVDDADRTTWVGDLKHTYFGDANLDGQFNSEDFVTVFIAGEYEDEVAGNSQWQTGDWNGDGDFDSNDFVVAFMEGGYEQGPKAGVRAVPEPTSLSCLLLAAAGLIGACRRSRR